MPNWREIIDQKARQMRQTQEESSRYEANQRYEEARQEQQERLRLQTLLKEAPSVLRKTGARDFVNALKSTYGGTLKSFNLGYVLFSQPYHIKEHRGSGWDYVEWQGYARDQLYLAYCFHNTIDKCLFGLRDRADIGGFESEFWGPPQINFDVSFLNQCSGQTHLGLPSHNCVLNPDQHPDLVDNLFRQLIS